MRKRNREIKLRVDENEYEILKNYAAKTGLSVNAYLRMLIQNRIPKLLPPAEYFELLHELNNCVENKIFNQNQNPDEGFYFSESYQEYLKRINDIEELLTAPEVAKNGDD